LHRKVKISISRLHVLQNSVALLKTLAIGFRNADWLCSRSFNEQDTAAQVAALKAAKCQRIYGKQASGGRDFLLVSVSGHMCEKTGEP
jgi:hypothetical protein